MVTLTSLNFQLVFRKHRQSVVQMCLDYIYLTIYYKIVIVWRSLSFLFQDKKAVWLMAQLMKLCSFGILLFSNLFLVWSLDIQAQVYKANNMQMSSSLNMLSGPLDQCTRHRSVHQSVEPLSGLVPGYPGAEIHSNEVTTPLSMLSNLIWS